MAPRVPIIDVTDLYHPPQDPGDNFDLIAAYALPEVDLRAVILDVSERFRQPYAGPEDHQDLRQIVRDPGVIPIAQLDMVFGRRVPWACGPFPPMRGPEDQMRDVPRYQQLGVELILDTLRNSTEPVEILSFGSLRAIAVAFNREPELLRARVGRVHVSAGTAGSAFREWNVLLDPLAFTRVLRSGLGLAIYPCATDDGAGGYGAHNTYWALPDLGFVRDMDPRLRRYLGYAIGEVKRVDFLRALDEDLPEDVMAATYGRRHNVWETAIWTVVSDRRLVRRVDGHHRLVPREEVEAADVVLPNRLLPCTLDVRDDGFFSFAPTDGGTTTFIYDRSDARENERALREALPALYTSFRPA